ncbi:MAG: hypothetical protein AB7G37_06470 [Solirubrobacteraceae bacterium]
MANHLTPEELADARGVDRTEIIAMCIQHGVPIYQGKIDRWLYEVAVRGQTPPVIAASQRHMN